jgi:hypothetical protein
MVAVVGSFLALFARRAGYMVLGAAFLVMLVVMVHDDIARHTWHLPGFTGFMGCAMLMAYFWGLLGSALWIVLPQADLHAGWSTFALDCFDLGFVMSMVIAHAFLIIPAILRRPVSWPRAMWAPLIVLNAGLLVGLVGALAGSTDIGRAASLLEVIALLGLIATVAATYVVTAVRKKTTGRKNQS